MTEDTPMPNAATRPTEIDPLIDPFKGREIDIIDGVYKGKKGWLNAQKGQPPKMSWVIVNMGDGEMRFTKVKKENVRIKPTHVPVNKFERALQEHLDIARSMDVLCRKISEFDMTPDELKLWVEIFKKQLHNAFRAGAKSDYAKLFRKVPPIKKQD